MEGADSARPDDRHQALWRAEKVRGQCLPEGADRPAPCNGGKRPCAPRGIRRGTAPGGVFPDRPWPQPEAYP